MRNEIPEEALAIAVGVLLQHQPGLTVEQLRAALQKPTTQKRKLITLKQAGEIIGCHPYTVRRYAQRGHLTQVSLSSRKKRYYLDQCEEFAQRGVIS
jgi:hypothetical protein